MDHRKKKCINPDCRSTGKSAKPAVRGLCEACYRALKRLIKAGKLTEQEAYDRGLWLKSQPPGAKRFPEEAGAAIVRPSMRQTRGRKLQRSSTQHS
jgi:hypothetical protein